MPIFEYQGKKYNVRDEHIDNFAKDYPDATSIQERDGKKYRVRSADYKTFMSETVQPQSSEQPIESAAAPVPVQEEPWKPTEQERKQIDAQMEELRRSTQRTMSEFNEGMENLREYREKSPLGSQTVESGVHFNPQSGEMERTYLTPLGNRYGSKGIADLESFRYRQAADMSVGGQLRRANQRLRELQAKRAERAEEVHSEWQEDFEKNKAPLAAVLAADTYVARQQSDRENSALDVAIRETEELIKNLEEQKDRESGVDVGFWRGFGRTVGDVRTWDFGMGDMRDALTMLHAEDLQGEDATEGEKEAYQSMMGAIHEREKADEMYGGNANFWNRAGVMTGYMPSFMLDFILTGGGYSGLQAAGRVSTKAATKVVGEQAIKEMAEQGFKTYVKNNGIKGFGREAANWTIKALGTTADDLLVRAPLMTNTVQAGETASDIIDRKLGNVVVGEDGNYEFANDKTWGDAVWQGEANAIIENYSEMFGAHLDPVVTLNNMSKLANLIGAKRLSGVLAKADAGALNGIMGQTHELFNKMGVSDYVGEISEEYYGQLWRTMLNLDDAYQQNPDGTRTNLLLSGQFHGDIWGGMALSMGLMGAGKHTLTAVDYMSAKHGVNKADTKANELLGTEIWEPMKATIDLTTNENIGEMADNIINDKDLTNEEKAAVLDYMERSLYMRGFNLATMAKSRNGERNEDIQQADESYIDGYSINSPQEMNDAKNLYEYHRQQVSNIVSDETLAMIDSNPVETLSRLNNGEINSSERNAVIDYINAKQVYEGMMQRVRDDLDGRIEQSNSMVDARVNRTTGRIQGATMKLDDRKVYVISGNLVPYDDGTGIDLSKSDNSIIIRDAETGTLEQVAPDAVLSVDESQDPNEQKVLAADAIRQQFAQDAANKIDGVITFNPGDTYTISGEDGTQAQIQIVANENGIVDNGDGTVNVSDGSGNIVPMPKDFIQQQVDAQNIARIAEFEQQRTAENLAKEQAAFEAQRPQYALNDLVTLQDENGNVIHGQIADIMDADGRYVVDVDSPINGKYAPSLTREELDNMLVEYNGVAYERPRVDSPANTETPETTETDNHDNSAGETLQGNMQGSALDRIPKDEQGQPIYEQVDSDTAWDAIVEQTEGDEAMAQNVADAMVTDKEAELNKIEKAKPKGGVSIAEKIAAERERKAAVDAARQQVEIWKKIAGTANRRKQAVEAERRRAADEAAALRRAEEERLRAEREEAERIEREALNGVPDMVDDVPKDARARGYRRVNGHKIDRQEPIPVIQGKEVAVKFSDNTIPSGHIAVIDASMLQPSHIAGMRNPLHFIDEAQPKERIDEASVLSAQKIAGNIRPEEITSSVTAYTGAPTVNARGEVIQGNNRSAALRNMWDGYKEQAEKYRQYLIEHAQDFGLTPEAIDNVEKPVLVNMLDVDDNTAIALGQYVAQDTESGGTERIKPKNALQRMGNDMRSFANLLLQSTDDDTSFAGLVDRNGDEVLKWMNQRGYITPTQYKSAFDSKGNITAEAKNDLRGIMYQSIFKDGSTRLEEMFNLMPAKAQKAILATAYRDYDSPGAERMVEEIQNSIRAYYALSQDNQFAEAKNFKEARMAVEVWKRQYQIDDVTGGSYLPAENYSNFALHLAAMYKGESQGLIQGTFNRLYDLIQGTQEENLFEQPDNTPRSLAQAINEALNIDYDGQQRSNLLAGDSSASQRGQQGGDGSPAPRERTEVGDGTADNTGGTESGGGEVEIDESAEEAALSSRVEVLDDDREESNGEYPTYKRSIIIDGKHTAIQVDEPNEKGEYTGSYFEYDGKRFAGIPEVVGYIDSTPTLGQKVAEAEKQVNTNPTEPQKEAGNYRKGHVQVGTFDVTIENPKGSVRSGVDADGNKWSVMMNNSYGYIRGTEGVDGDHIDVFLSDDIDGWNGSHAFVIDQYNEDGTFDEHKVMLGFNEADEAQSAFTSNYDKEWAEKRKLVCTPVTIEEFEKWINSSHRKTKPFAEYKTVKKATATPGNESKPDGYTVERRFHKKNGTYIHAVKFTEQMPRERFLELKKRVKDFGGYYSSFGKGGFIFDNEADADKFAQAVLDPTGEQLDDAAPVSIADLREITATKSESDIQPIGHGAFGDIYDQFKGKAQEAIAFLSEKQGGEAIGALHHKDVGDIDLVWGNEGTGHSDGFGLAKLVKYHPEVLNDLQGLIDDMHVVSRNANRINLESDTHKAAVRLEWDGEKKNWLLTAFEKENSVRDNTTDTGTTVTGKQNDTATLRNTVSIGKNTEESKEKQGEEVELSEKMEDNAPFPEEVEFYEKDVAIDEGRLVIGNGEGMIGYRHAGELPEAEGECQVERAFRENNAFSFSGKERVETADDVAFIFRELENASVENSFAVLVKEGKPTVVHLGMGGFMNTQVNTAAIRAAYDAVGADKIYFVHNHPSGALRCSREDMEMLRTVKGMFGRGVVQDGIIIDTASGQYGIFTEEGNHEAASMPEGVARFPLKLYSFDRQVFSRDYDLAQLRQVRSSEDVAAFVSSQRMGQRGKTSFLVLDTQNRIIGNLHTSHGNLESDGLAEEIASKVIRFGGVSAVVYGNMELDPSAIRDLNREVARISGKSVRLLDIVSVDGLNTMSAVDYGMLMERQEAYAPENGDIRYREDGNGNSLVAVHNLSAEKLEEAFDLGGFPMPSIAVTKAEVGHTEFGEISLIFGKESINPADKRNKVYGEDAWTPTFPAVGYKLNDDKTSDIYRRANKAGNLPLFNPVIFHPDNYERHIEGLGSESLVEHFKDDYGAKQLYLSETGNAIEEYEQHEVDKYLPDQISLYEKMLKEIGIERLKNERNDVVENDVKRLIEEHYNIDLDAMKPFRAKVRISTTIHRAIDYTENGNRKTENDIEATKRKIDERIDPKKFESWLEDLFADVVEKKGIRNDRDMFTPSGSIRKWEQLYDDITLDSVVNAMQRQSARGGQGLFNGSIFGAAQQEYKNIDAIRKEARERIRAISHEDYEVQRSAITDRLSNIKISGVGNGFSDTMDMAGNIQDAVARSHTAKGIHKYLKEFYPKVTMDTAKEIADIVKDIQRMSARYFEAKPYRAVRFDEVRLAVLPSSTDKKIVQELEQRGIPVRTYEQGNEAQRRQIVEEASDELNLRFREEEDVNGRFNEELEGLTEENADSTILMLGRPSTVLLAAGIPDRNIALYGNKLLKKAKAHGYSKQDVKDLPRYVANPIAVFKGSYVDGYAILTEMPINGKNALVSIDIRKGEVQDLNLVTSVFGKNTKGIVGWLNDGKLLYADKKKTLDYLSSSAPIADATNNQEISSATKVVRNFENSNLKREERIDDDNVPYKKPTRAERRDMVKRVNELAKKLHLDNVEVVTSMNGLDGKKARAKGFYTKSSQKITIVIPNNRSVADAEMTLLHEAVAHYGLRQMFGKHFDTFLDNVFNNASEDVRQKIVDLSKKYGWDFGKATEEYLAGLAERTDFENARKTGWWQKIKDFFIDMLHKIGLPDFRGVTLTDNELRYILWRSYENLKGNRFEDVFTEAADTSMQYELKVGEYAADVQDDTMYRDGDPEIHERTLARDRYEQRVRSGMYQTKEALQDCMLGLEEAMRAIMGNKKFRVEEVPDFENAYLGENRLSSMNEKEAEAMGRTLFKPMLDEVAKLAPTRAARDELTDYMMAKHGLERNTVMAERDAKTEYEKRQKEHPNSKLTLQDFIDKFRKRDYAGLTALTGYDDVASAEAEAQQMVNDYESLHDTADLWKRVNAVSKAILQKSYECGMMSKATYDSISDMYEFYIPLRGFDEKTSAEAYSYLTHRQSAFNAPIKKAEGRRSKADDPFANLQSMAESAIMQGNRNKLVKQRFLNFALNHPSDLVSINDLWLQYDSVADEWKPVFPDNIEVSDSPETVEQKMHDFEEKMNQLEQQSPDLYKRGRDAENIPYRVIDSRDLRQHQVVVKRGGRDYVITINGNPRAVQALNGQTNPDNDISGSVGKILSYAGDVNRTLSSLYTSLQPDFVASNFVRDLIYSNTMAWIKESPNYALRYNWNYARLNPVKMKHLFAKYRKGTLDMNDKTEAMFKLFLDNGGETGYARLMDIEQHKKNLEKAMKALNQKIPFTEWRKHLAKWVGEIGRGIETQSRFAAFITSREFGRDIGRSIWDAKEISVNFNKKGSGDKFLGAEGQTFIGNAAAMTGGLGRAFIIFWNAAVQGTFGNFIKNAKRHPAKALAAVATWYGLALLISALGASDDDEEDDEHGSYYDIPVTTRRNNIIVKGPGKSWIKIPLPIEYRAVYGMGELCGSTLFHNEPLRGHELLSQFTQLTPIDIMAGQNLEQGGEFDWLAPIIPSSLKPAYEVRENKSWTGLPIYKDTPWNKDMPDWTKTYKNANKQIVDLCAWLNELSGGTHREKGAIDINPAKVEYLLRGYAGGFWTLTDQLFKLGETAIGKRDFDWRYMPLLNRVVTNGDERTSFRAINNEYFRIKEERDETMRLLKGYTDDAKKGVFGTAERVNFIYYSPEYQRALTFDIYNKQIEDINDLIRTSTDEETIEAFTQIQNEYKRALVDAANKINKRK